MGKREGVGGEVAAQRSRRMSWSTTRHEGRAVANGPACRLAHHVLTPFVALLVVQLTANGLAARAIDADNE